MTKIRCTDCRNLDQSDDYCERLQYFQDHPRHWRRCEYYAGPQPVAAIRAALADADLDQYVLVLADLGGGQRALRLRHNVPERERFSIYRIVGLKVREPERIQLRGKTASQQSAPASPPSRRAA